MTIRPLELIEPFLSDVRPSKPDMCREVLQVALARHFPSDPRRDREFSTFFYQASVEVYVNVYAAGSGTGHTFKLLERWFRWMGKKGHLQSEDVALWLFELERSRRTHMGMKPRYMRLPDGKQLSAKDMGAALAVLRIRAQLDAYLQDVDEAEREIAELAVKHMAVWLAENRGVPIILADFDPAGYIATILASRRPLPKDACLLHHAASFLEKYRTPAAVVAKTRELALSLAFAA